MSDSVRPHRQQPTRLLCPWDSPGKNTGVGCHFLLQCIKVKSESEVAQSCPTLSDPMDYSLPGSSVHLIFQARVLEWGARFCGYGLLFLLKYFKNMKTILSLLTVQKQPFCTIACQPLDIQSINWKTSKSHKNQPEEKRNIYQVEQEIPKR